METCILLDSLRGEDRMTPTPDRRGRASGRPSDAAEPSADQHSTSVARDTESRRIQITLCGCGEEGRRGEGVGPPGEWVVVFQVPERLPMAGTGGLDPAHSLAPLLNRLL